MTPLERVTARVMRAGDPEQPSVPAPLLSLEEFFDGNDCVGSIGCNLASEPDPAEFFRILKIIRTKPEVSDVRVQITCVDFPGEEWPYSDTIWLATSANADEVATWFPEHLAPSEVWEGWLPRKKYEPLSVAEGHRLIAAWYD